MPRKTWSSLRDRTRRGASFNEAAARCRGKPGGAARRARCRRASMRPRPDAAENFRLFDYERDGTLRFNEAAARCRGKRPSA